MLTFYLFLASGISLLVFYVGVVFGISETIDALFGSSQYWSSLDGGVMSLGYAFVAGLLWFYHWRLLNARRQTLSDDSRGLLRFYLFCAVILTAIGIYLLGGSLIASGMSALIPPYGGDFSAVFSGILSLGLSLGLWFHHMKIFVAEYPPVKKQTRKATA